MATVTAIKNKTQSKTAMRKVVEYVSQPAKTMWQREGEAVRLVSGKDCLGESALQEFLSTKRRHRKETGRWFYQYVQSFKPGENATPEQVHQMGLELAVAFEGYEVLVATHIDNDHWHNHLIVNSVNHETGLKLQFNEQDLHRLRDRSDEICRAYGLDTLEPYQKPSTAGIRTGEYRAAMKGDSWKFRLMTDIDRALQSSRDRREFIAQMTGLGYAVRWETQHKNITYTTPEGKKCRDSKLHEDKYLKASMEEYFEHRGRTQTVERPEPAGRTAAPSVLSADPGTGKPAGTAGYEPASIHERLAHYAAVAAAGQKADNRTGKRKQAEHQGADHRPAGRSGDNRRSANSVPAPKMKKKHIDRDDR